MQASLRSDVRKIRLRVGALTASLEFIQLDTCARTPVNERSPISIARVRAAHPEIDRRFVLALTSPRRLLLYETTRRSKDSRSEPRAERFRLRSDFWYRHTANVREISDPNRRHHPVQHGAFVKYLRTYAHRTPRPSPLRPSRTVPPRLALASPPYDSKTTGSYGLIHPHRGFPSLKTHCVDVLVVGPGYRSLPLPLSWPLQRGGRPDNSRVRPV